MKEGQEMKINYVRPNDEVFESGKGTSNVDLTPDGLLVNVLERVDYPESGGIYSYYIKMKYPRQSMPWPEAVKANDIAKRVTMFFANTFSKRVFTLPMIALAILPWKMKVRALNDVLTGYCRTVEFVLSPFFLKEYRYTKIGRELRPIIRTFLSHLGIGSAIADSVAKCLVTLIQLDDAYRYRLQDIFSALDDCGAQGGLDYILTAPRKALKSAIEIVTKREMPLDANYPLSEMTPARFQAVGKILSLVLLVPKIRKALRVSMQNCNYENLCMDEADAHHTLVWPTYNFGGISSKERIDMYVEAYTVSSCCGRDVDADTEAGYICKWCHNPCELAYDLPMVAKMVKKTK